MLSRLQANGLLLLVAIIWGTAFVAQKDAFAHVGAYTFVAARFVLSFLLVLPLALREYKKGIAQDLAGGSHFKSMLWLCPAFAAGVLLQQIGIGETTVTNAGFLTGLYVLFVPLICLLFYKQKLSPWIFPAALTSLGGLYLLVGGHLDGFSNGDLLVIGAALGFAVQVVLVGRIMAASKAVFTLCAVQYAAVGLVAGVCMLWFETPTLDGLYGAIWPIIYTGVISGGIAYTLQVVAQQFTPAPDSAIILSGEALFAAIAGALIMGDRLNLMQYGGCLLIAAAILMVELAPLVFKKRKAAAA